MAEKDTLQQVFPTERTTIELDQGVASIEIPIWKLYEGEVVVHPVLEHAGERLWEVERRMIQQIESDFSELSQVHTTPLEVFRLLREEETF